MHVVRLVGGIGYQGVEFEILVVDIEIGLDVEDRRLFEVVARQVGEQGAQVLEGILLVGRHVVGDAVLGVVRAGAAELLELDVLAGDALDDLGAGDEHVRGLVDHDDEVGDGGGVDRAAGARAEDQ